jgi:hypothetical protein
VQFTNYAAQLWWLRILSGELFKGVAESNFPLSEAASQVQIGIITI